MAGSGASYSKVVGLLFETKEFRNRVATLREDFLRPPESWGVSFTYAEDHGGPKLRRYARPEFWAYLKIGGLCKKVSTTNFEHFSVPVSVYSTVGDEVYREIFNRTFGYKPTGSKHPVVPTYNCTTTKVWEKFVSAARDRVRSDLDDAIDRSSKNLRNLWGSIEPETLRVGCEDALHRKAVDCIRAEILRWVDQVPPQVLQQGLDESLAHLILEA